MFFSQNLFFMCVMRKGNDRLGMSLCSLRSSRRRLYTGRVLDLTDDHTAMVSEKNDHT